MTTRDDPFGRPAGSREDAEAEAAALLAALARPEAATPARLRDALEDAAERAGVLDIAYRSLDTPLGSLLLAATPHGLVRVAFASEDHEAVLATLAERLSPRILRAPKRLDAVARQIDEYFAGRRTSFDVPLDLALSRGFRRDVLEHLRGIGYGTTQSYSEVARVIGHPRAARAVGSACAANPLPIVLPCHRVVRSDGGLGGYAGGLAAKTILLRLERAA